VRDLKWNSSRWAATGVCFVLKGSSAVEAPEMTRFSVGRNLEMRTLSVLDNEERPANKSVFLKSSL
jgi:hypothetical protein